jgi:excisionase family DNA binding protein
MTKRHIPKPDDRLLTVSDIAERDHCSTKTVRRAIAKGDLEVLRIGPGRRMIRITEDAHLLYRVRANTRF